MDDIALSKDKSNQVFALILLAGLLLLRLPFLTGIAFFARPGWLEPTFQIATYLLTACLVWWERDRLSDFHIDKLALDIIIFFKPVQTIILSIWEFNDNPLAFPQWLSLSLWIIAACLLFALWRSHPNISQVPRASFGWFGFGILAGLFAVLLLSFPMSFQVDKSQLLGKPPTFALLLQALPSLFYRLGYAAVTEEPLFRGFLWGYLQKAGWKNVWIWLFPAGLFTLGHIYYIKKAPISFWLIVPLDALILGAVVWRSKTISSSLAAHATMNALGYTMGYIIASFR